MSAKEIEWLPNEVEFTVSAQLQCIEKREETILTIFKSSRAKTDFPTSTKSITSIFAVGSIGQKITGTSSTEGSKRILIEGKPGIGITALAKEIAYSWATNEILIETKIVFLLYLRDPQLQSITTTKQLVEYMSMGCLNDEQIETFSKYLVNTKGQELCIVMDGFNEYPTLLQKNSFIIDIINSIVLPKAIVVITSRPTVAASLYNQVDRRFNMIGFSTKKQTGYVSEVILDMRKYDHQLIADYPLIAEYPLNPRCPFHPLYLALLLCLSHHKGSLLKNQNDLAEIIGLFILHTVYQHTVRYIPSHPVDESQDTSKFITDILYNLSELAFKGLQEHKLVFTFDEIKQVCPYIDEAFIGLGLLQMVEYYPYKGAGTTTSFSFLHYTMQEFLAALHVSILPSEQQSTLIENTFWEDYYFFMWEIFANIPKIINFTPHAYGQYIREKIDTVIPTVIATIHDSIIHNCKKICFSGMNIFAHHFSSLMFLISNLSIQWKTLEITHCKMTDIEMSTLQGYISDKLSTLEYVDLSHNDSSPWGVYCAIIRHCNVTNLALCGIKAYEMRQYVDDITKSLQMNNNLQSLTLYNILGNVKPILSCIVTSIEFNLPCKKMSSTHSVDDTKSVLLHIALQYKSSDTVPVSDNSRIVKVNLMCHRSCDPSTIENLNTLDASSQRIDDYGVTIVTTFCDKHKIINLSNNEISHIGAETISEYLKNNICLLELNLSGNWIGLYGIAAIAKAIQVNVSLQKFNISRCRIADDGAKNIAEAIQMNVTLQKLDISYNRISDDGAAAISDSLKHNNSLQELNLSQNNISNNGAKKIAEAIQMNVTLQKLDISYNIISDDGAAADIIKCNNSLQVLDISCNKMINSVANKIAKAIQVNSTLHALYLHQSPVTNAKYALDFNQNVLNGVHLNSTLKKLTLIRLYGNDEALIQNEIEEINKQRIKQGRSKVEILMKVQKLYS